MLPELGEGCLHGQELSLTTHIREATNTKGETDSYWGFDHLGQVLDHLGLDRAKLGGRSQTML